MLEGPMANDAGQPDQKTAGSARLEWVVGEKVRQALGGAKG